MPQYSKGLEAIDVIRKKKQLAKAKRLAAGKPKWKDEKYMTPEEYEAYIDGFLRNGDKDIEKVKIAVQMFDKKQKYQSKNDNPLEEEL